MLLHLIRHAPSAVDPSTPAETWGLAEHAPAAAQALLDSGCLPRGDTAWFCSPEPKTVQTAGLLHDGPVVHDARLKEQLRGATWFEDPDTFVAAVRRTFAEPDRSAVPGWEPLATTRARVVAAVEDIVAAQRDRDAAVLVGHGTAWTVLVAALTGTPPDLDAWQAMTMPDHCLLDPSAGRLLSGWGAWR